jgi:hypothetical protein
MEIPVKDSAMKLQFSLTSKTCVIAALVFSAGLIHASPIVYTANTSDFVPGGQTLGINGGTVSGTIETDGTIGTLDSSDILGWSLLLNDGTGQTFTLNPGNSTATLTGTATTATASLLQFNYDTPDDGALGYFEILDSTDGWGLGFALPGSTANGGITNPDGASDIGILSFDPQPITIGTAAPEPSTSLLLLSSALGMLGVVRALSRMRG